MQWLDNEGLNTETSCVDRITYLLNYVARKRLLEIEVKRKGL
jgi:hypothetical protein